MTDETLVRPLFPGKIDVVGDVHGEIDALQRLLGRLGYDDSGHHREDRRLVFVGDLTDRGPNSPAVVDLVRQLLHAGRAQCVLGNHEFNLLRRTPKPEASWLLDSAPPLQHHGVLIPQTRAGTARRGILRFFEELPLALIREDVRVVHACWDEHMVNLLRHETDVLEVHEHYRERIARELRRAGRHDEITATLAHQNGNPVKVLTSGHEERAARPLVINGKPREEMRVPWWRHYSAGPLVVFGHYWRGLVPGDGEDLHLFHGHPRECSLGGGAAMCIDYSVGKRYRERLRPGFNQSYVTHLAALRLPERTLYFDNEDTPVPLAALRSA